MYIIGCNILCTAWDRKFMDWKRYIMLCTYENIKYHCKTDTNNVKKPNYMTDICICIVNSHIFFHLIIYSILQEIFE